MELQATAHFRGCEVHRKPLQTAQLRAHGISLLMCEHNAGMGFVTRQPIRVDPAEVCDVETVQHSTLLRRDFQLLFIRAANHAGIVCGRDVDAT